MTFRRFEIQRRGGRHAKSAKMNIQPISGGIPGRYPMKALLPIAALAVVLAHGQAVVAPQEDVSSQAAIIAPAPELASASVAAIAPPAQGPVAPLYVYVPMTNRQKLNWTMGCIVSPTWLFYSGARAAFDQWRDDPASWGQGAKGYARRYAAAHELEAFEDTVWFAGAALTHEDPRYLRSGRNGFLPRLLDALEVGMLSRRDNGSVGFAYARTVAGLGTEMFEGVVFPDERAFTTGAIVTAAFRYVILREAQSVGREFLPDLLKGDASRAVRNLGLPLTTPVRPQPATLPNASALLPPQP
jgi:hypothetical protein